MTHYRIPFNKPGIVGNELRYLNEAISGGHTAGDGAFTTKCRDLLERSLGVARALLTTSCTHALELAALLLNIQPGDEVIVPSFTFVSTVNAFVLRGAKPVFIDIRPDTLNLDEAQLSRLITSRTKAVVPVHYAGVGCEMDSILHTARTRNIAVVEDNAHGLMGKYKGKFLGTFGDLSTLSFHETKNVICGEGGALLINDERYVERAEILREKGTDRSRFFRGQVDKYTWIDIGSSYVLSDLLAAFLFGQLERIQEVSAARQRIWTTYSQGLADWGAEHGVTLPYVPTHCDQTFHIFYLLMPSLGARQALIEHLASHGILSVFHYLPLHLSPMGKQAGGQTGQCPVTESVSERLVRLPLYRSLSDGEQAEVIDTVRSFSGWDQPPRSENAPAQAAPVSVP